MRYFKVPYDIILRDDLSKGEKWFLLELMQKESEFNKEGKWFDVGYKDISLDHHFIKRYRQSLKEKGLIDYINGCSVNGVRKNTQYLLKIERFNSVKEEKQEVNESPNIKDNKPKTRINCFGKEIDESF